MTTEPKRHNHLSNNSYTMPEFANGAYTAKQVRETLLATDGWIIAHGRRYDIVTKPLGAGVYQMKLVRTR